MALVVDSSDGASEEEAPTSPPNDRRFFRSSVSDIAYSRIQNITEITENPLQFL